MPSQLFFVRLTSERPDFASTMTPQEQAVMREHALFLKEQLEAGKLVVAGPVLDPGGTFGMGVFEAESAEELRALMERDPARAIGRHTISPMGPSTFRRSR